MSGLTCSVPTGWTTSPSGQDKAYKKTDTSLQFFASLQRCLSEGAHMAVPKDRDTYEDLKSMNRKYTIAQFGVVSNQRAFTFKSGTHGCRSSIEKECLRTIPQLPTLMRPRSGWTERSLPTTRAIWATPSTWTAATSVSFGWTTMQTLATSVATAGRTKPSARLTALILVRTLERSFKIGDNLRFFYRAFLFLCTEWVLELGHR